MKRLETVGWLVAIVLGGCAFNQDDAFHDRPVVSLEDAPPPIAGGTLAISRDGRFAIASDPDLDRVLRVDLTTHEVRAIALGADVEPGRVVEDGAGRAYVVLRRGGALAEIDLEGARATRRIEVCPSPRGLALDAEGDLLHVACAGGALITLGPARDPIRTLALAPDLRDVVVTAEGVLVSRFRSAEVVRVGPDGVVGRAALPLAVLTGVNEDGDPTELTQTYRPGVGVRMRAASGGAVLLHQRARVGEEAVFRGRRRRDSGYTYSNRPVTARYEDYTVTWRDPCGNAVVHAAASLLSERGEPLHAAPSIPQGVVPVDIAASPGGQLAIAFAGEPGGPFRFGPQVVETTLSRAAQDRPGGCLASDRDRSLAGQAVAVAYAGETLVVQLRAPAGLTIGDAHVPLDGASARDSGHEVFHLDTGGGIACASCHPGGGDDGHVWDFAAVAPVRTMPLQGTVGLAPYHRAGDVATFERLMSSLAEQMAGPTLDAPTLGAVRSWLARLPPPASGPVEDPAAVARGEAVFMQAGCAECHAGALGTDGRSHRVGDGEWQTPTLVGIALRPPYLHDGSAATLAEAMVGADAGEHGDLTSADAAARADLIAYLRAR